MNNLFSNIDLGELQELLDQSDVRDVSCGRGIVTVTSNTFGTYRSDIILPEETVLRLVNQVANKMELEFNAACPFLEGEFETPNYFIRVSAFHSHISPNGTELTLRKVTKENVLSEEYMIESDFAPQFVIERLKQYVQSGCNILVIGETGSGKTQLLKWLAAYIPNQQRIVTIEDSIEFQFPLLYPEKNVLEVRVRDGITYSEMIAKCLRQNLQWLILQEAREKEVDDLLDGMTTGCKVMTTMHTTDSVGVTNRVLQMLKLDSSIFNTLDQRIHSLIDVVIYLKKDDKKGIHRYIESILEYDCVELEAKEEKVWQRGKSSFKESLPKIHNKLSEVD